MDSLFPLNMCSKWEADLNNRKSKLLKFFWKFLNASDSSPGRRAMFCVGVETAHTHTHARARAHGAFGNLSHWAVCVPPSPSLLQAKFWKHLLLLNEYTDGSSVRRQKAQAQLLSALWHTPTHSSSYSCLWGTFLDIIINPGLYLNPNPLSKSPKPDLNLNLTLNPHLYSQPALWSCGYQDGLLGRKGLTPLLE